MLPKDMKRITMQLKPILVNLLQKLFFLELLLIHGAYTTTDIPMTSMSSSNSSQFEPTVFVPEDNSGTDNNDTSGVTPEHAPNSPTVSKIPLYFGGFSSFGGLWVSSGIIPSVEMGLDHINARSDILPDYELKVVWNDTQCEAALGTRVLFDQLFHEPEKIAIIGDGCSTSSQAIAGTAYHWNLVVMSYASSAPTLSNRIIYPYFYRTIVTDTEFNPARIRVMKEFGWNKVGTIHGKHEIFSLTADHLIEELNKANITILTSETFASEDPSHQIQNLKTSDAKIITVNAYPTKARRIFCEAYKNDMLGPGYVWMMVGWYAKKWWEEPDPLVPCTLEEMRQAARSSYYISTESLQLSPSSDVTIGNITAAQYVELLREYMRDPKWSDFVWHGDHPFGYDAAWALGLMFDKAVPILKEMGKRLEDFTYDDSEMARVFFELLNTTKFIGASGPVSFRNGDRVGIIQIRQLQAGCFNSSWILHDEECFLFVDQPLSFSDATQYCESVGSAMAAIVNETEYNFIADTLSNTAFAERIRWYIGLKKIGRSFEWLDNRFDGTDWVPPGSRLDVNGDEDCVFITSGAENGWETTSCDEKLPFICRTEGELLERNVAMFTDNGAEGIFEVTGKFIWPGGQVPLDHTPKVIINIKTVHKGISLILYISMCVLASIGILMALFFFAFNVKYRDMRVVKMSSPNLNNLIILGGIFVYSTIAVGGLDSNLVSERVEAILCQLRVWFLSLGFVLAFGSMFSKTWRVHKIAAFKTPKRVIITDQQLFLMVFVFLFIDVSVLVVWNVIDPLGIDTRSLHEIEDPEVANQRLAPYYEYCSCKYQIYWLASLYSYKALLLIFGAFLAWETRKVQIAALNDSKLIGISVYNVIVLCTIGVSVSFIISDDPATLYIFTSCVVLFCTTITLVIIFIPKIISVHKYGSNGPPDGTSNNRPLSRAGTLATNKSFDQLESVQEECDRLKQKNAQLEEENKRLRESHPNGGASALANESRLKSGCGLWCAGVMCGCCADDPKETYKPTQNGNNNNAFEVSENI